jgi:preprotein translocase subunit SecF
MFTDGAVRNFAIVLCLGIVLGAFSSTFVAPAIYLFFRKNFFHPETGQKPTGPTREERARGIV